MPPDSVLWPLLLYINDLPDGIESKCRLSANDAVPCNTRENQLIVQKGMELLEKWAEKWQMTFNVSKCLVLSIRERNSSVKYYLVGQA